MEFVYLQGTEQVQSAARQMRDAADVIRSSIDRLVFTIESRERNDLDSLLRFEFVVEKLVAAIGELRETPKTAVDNTVRGEGDITV